MINRQELVATLKSQHQQLQTDLGEAMEKAKNLSPLETIKKLDQFKKDIQTHLDLENTVFYPNYLETNQENEKIKKFINDMIIIGEKVMTFLDKYDTADKIASLNNAFISELEGVIKILSLRIEMEEEALYDVYASS